MGKKIDIKLSILIILFSITSVSVYWSVGTSADIDKPMMTPYFSNIEGYRIVHKHELPQNAADMLNLDDFTYLDYSGPDGAVNLYIGYYYSAGKAYAAHSPLVCYPSQGWKIIKKAEKHYLDVASDKIEYDEIITSYGEKKELVLYWYQAGRFTTTNVYKNKFLIGYNKISNKSEQHAFLRVAAPIEDSYETTKAASIEFIKAFYPYFLKYIKES